MDSSSLIRPLRTRATLVIVLALTGCASHTAAPPAPPFVATAIASAGVIHPTQRLAGIIAPYENVAIQSTLTEPADSVPVQEGDTVTRGELLAQLDTADLQAQLEADLATATSQRAGTTHSEYQGSLNITTGIGQLSSAQAGVQQARANLQRDERDLERDESLLQSGYISEQQVQSQEATVRDDQASLRTAQADLVTARSTVVANGGIGSPGLQSSSVQQAAAQEQVAVAQADEVRVMIAKATIVSPVDGVVVNRNINPGEYPGTRQIFTVQQIDPIFAILHGSSDQVANIEPHASAQIQAPDPGGRDLLVTGSVIGVLNQIIPGSTDFEVKILIRNPAHALRPGMAVVGAVALPAVRGIRIPTTAFTDDNHDTIDVVTPMDTIKTVKVAELAGDGTTSIVTGVAPGTRVVADGQTSVGDGEKVSVK